MKDSNDLVNALQTARADIAIDSVVARRAAAVAEGIRRRDEMQAEREDDGGSPDAAA